MSVKFVVLLVGLLGCVVGDDGPIVDTTYGPVQGTVVEDLQGRRTEEFYGIPFAKPPVGPLRWERPQNPEPWEDVYDATYYRDHCIQFLTPLYPLVNFGANHSEDCLHLNVYVPESVRKAREANLPVMFFIHGGGYTFGTAEMYPGTGLASQGDVVVVNTNYRLSVLGFLTTGDDAAKGNQLLWDITAALQWTNDNVAAFGGDPDRITIFGHSAGADAVSHLMLSPYAQDLFHRGIALSGGNSRNMTMRGTAQGAADATRRFATFLNCTQEDSVEMLNCMREYDGELIYNLGNAFAGWSWIIDDEFIPMEPGVAWKNGVAKDLDYMGGCTHHDSAGFVLGNPIAFPLINYTLASSRTWNTTRNYVRNRMGAYFDDAEGMADMMYERYPGLDSEDVAIRTEALSFYDTHNSFGGPTHYQAELHSENEGRTGGTYWYIYQYHNTFLHGYPDWVEGSHMDDIYSVLGEPFMYVYRLLWLREDFDEVDRQVKEDVMSYYVNFAYTGNPNEGPRSVPVEWPEYNTDDRHHIIFSDDMRAPSIDEELLDNYNFWMHELPRLVEEERGNAGGQEREDDSWGYGEEFMGLTVEEWTERLPEIISEMEEYASDMI